MKPINEAIDNLVAPSYALPGGGSVKIITSQVDDAAASATEKVVMSSAQSAKTKPNQIHHIATNKSSAFTPKFNEIVGKYGLELDEEFNKVLVPHQGRHPIAYHEYILSRIKDIDNAANGDTTKFLDAYNVLKQEIIDNPGILYKK
jgi:hypothetical protein